MKASRTKRGNIKITMSLDDLEKIVYALMNSTDEDFDVFTPLNEYLAGWNSNTRDESRLGV